MAKRSRRLDPLLVRLEHELFDAEDDHARWLTRLYRAVMFARKTGGRIKKLRQRIADRVEYLQSSRPRPDLGPDEPEVD